MPNERNALDELLQNPNPDTEAYRIYLALRRDIRRGLIEPGQQLRTTWLRETFKASTSPLREALARLNAEHYVTAEGKRGFRVAELTHEDYVSIVEMRDDLESSALRKSILNRTEAWEGRVLLAHHFLSKTRTDHMGNVDSVEVREERHRLFHLQLLSGCGSTWFLRICNHLSDHAERYRVLLRDTVVKPSYYDAVDQEHRQLFELALDGQADQAITLLRVHRQRTYDPILRRLANPKERVSPLR